MLIRKSESLRVVLRETEGHGDASLHRQREVTQTDESICCFYVVICYAEINLSNIMCLLLFTFP